jgi:hypothetical protein
MRVRRVPVVDEYVDGEEAAVFVDDNVVVLSPLATYLLGLVADDWTELTTLAEALVGAFGHPPTGESAAEATADALRTLEAQGIVAIADPGSTICT